MYSDCDNTYRNRVEAGKKLALKLRERAFPDPYVLALPRGGVIVANEVARLLGAPLDVVVSRKIGSPGHLEYGIGALSEDEEPLRTLSPKSLILAVPVGPVDISPMVTKKYDEIICLQRPGKLQAVGECYRDFRQVRDEEVLSVLSQFHIHRDVRNRENQL